MKFEEALKKAEAIRGSEVALAGDLGDRWLFSFVADENKIGTAPICIYKESGNYEYVSVAEYTESLLSGEIEYRAISLKTTHNN